MAHNFQRPNLPYEGTSLDNDNRYQLLTGQSRGVHFAALDGEANFYIDALRQLDADIANLVAGNLQGSDNPANAGFMVTTDGAGNIGWIKVQDSNIVPASISRLSLIPGTITANEIANSAIGSLQLAPSSVTTSKIAALSITRNEIAIGTITNIQIAAATILGSNIAPNTITTGKILPATILGSNIAAATILTGNIAAATILGSNIAANTITTGNILPATILGSNIAPLTITSGLIANNTITFTQISNAFTATKAQQQAAASSSVYTSPATQQYHPSADSFKVNFVGATGSRNVSYNVSSVTRNSVGNYTINFTNNFAAAVFGVNITITDSIAPRGNAVSTVVLSRTSSSVTILTYIAGGSPVDYDDVSVSGFGTLA